MDAKSAGAIDSFLEKLVNMPVGGEQDAAKRARKWAKKVKKMYEKLPPESELPMFHIPELNGPGKCRRMCDANAPPAIAEVTIKSLFPSRVLRIPVAAGADGGSPQLVAAATLITGQ